MPTMLAVSPSDRRLAVAPRHRRPLGRFLPRLAPLFSAGGAFYSVRSRGVKARAGQGPASISGRVRGGVAFSGEVAFRFAAENASNATDSVAQAGRVGDLFPMRQALGDDLRRLHGRLAQGRVFDDLTLDAGAFGGQHLTQRLQLAAELVDLLHRGPRHPLQQ